MQQQFKGVTMTATQLAKANRSTPEYKLWVKALRAVMKDFKAKGVAFDHLATCPDSYALYLKVKYA
jgi:hypothetical protein